MILGNKSNIKLIVQILKEQNIKNLVINPGGTNIELVKQVQDDSFFHCYSVVDERSALYFGIGIYIQTGEPVVMICTSAQATRNYVPGLTEAFYKRVPILAITMEKHPRFKYQEYMQAPDQSSLPQDCVKKSFELPYVRDINDIYHSRRLINEAILELVHNGKGPVQLVVPWLDFEIKEIIPKQSTIKMIDLQEKFNFDNKKILIVIGEHRKFSNDELEAISYFCDNTNTVVYTNHLSNYNGKYSVNGNFLLTTITDEKFENIKPDILISIGGQTGDYPFYLRFSKTEYIDIEHWRICEDGKIVDTYDKLKFVFQGNEKDFFNNVNKNEINHNYFNNWKKMNENLDTNIDLPYSNVSIAKYLSNRIPSNSIIQFSILNSLRVWNLFQLDSSIECYSNVGAFGIDGGMSTLIGQSIVSDELSFLVIGDLAFYYDMNSLGIRHIKNNLRILIINNNGGIEFKFGEEDKNKMNQYIAAGNHFKNAKGWAETCGFEYLKAENMKEFINCSERFINKSNKPIVLEAFVRDVDESDAYHLLINHNIRFSKKEFIGKIIHKAISLKDKGLNKLKKMEIK